MEKMESFMEFQQRTLKAPAQFQGVGLHSGQNVLLRLMPAPVNHGIVFVRTDLPKSPGIPARSEFVVDTSLATTLGKGEARVGTVEHLLSALYGLGIDNLRVELDGPEVPIMDGSSVVFVQRIRETGLRIQDEPKSFLLLKKPVSVTEGGKAVTLSPSNRFVVDCTIDFRHPLISDQTCSFEFSEGAFLKEIARARTFGFLKDVEMLQKMGLARGGNLENAIVVDEFSILNPEGLRFPDEFVRHKVLDAVGDLALLGHPVVGHLQCVKSGHALHHKLVQKILSDPSSYSLVRAHHNNLELLKLRLPGVSDLLDAIAV